MANIELSDLQPRKNEFSVSFTSNLGDLSREEMNVTQGGFFYNPPSYPYWQMKVSQTVYSYGKNKGWW